MFDGLVVMLLWATVILSVIVAGWMILIVYCDGKEWAARVAAILFALAVTLVGTIYSDSVQMAGTIVLVVGLGLCLALLQGLVGLARKRQKIAQAATPAEAATEQ